jgi:hypothetical protein
MPDEFPVDVHADIREASEDGMVTHDSTLRWLSGEFLSDLEDALNAQLPEGFYCKIEGGEIQ